MYKIYVASSWRNSEQPLVVDYLRNLGHQVYDFKAAGDGWQNDAGVGGFSWSEIDPNWKYWDTATYLEALNTKIAQKGFDRDMNALKISDIVVAVFPFGVSASLETGYACGNGKFVIAYVPSIKEPELMIKMASIIVYSLPQIELSIKIWEKTQK